MRKTFRWNFFHGSVFQSSVRVGSPAIRPDILLYLYLPVVRAHVSISCGFPIGFGFLGNLSRLGLRLVTCSDGLESVKRVTLFRTSIHLHCTKRSAVQVLRDVRTVLYAGSLYE